MMETGRMKAEAGRVPVVNGYIDGYNFYLPIHDLAEEQRDAGILHLAWCNYCKLVERLAQQQFGRCILGMVKLFTAYARDEVRRELSAKGLERKEHWLEVVLIEGRGKLHISYGRWERQGDGEGHGRTKEKLTDVKLAISLVRDACWAQPAGVPAPAVLADLEHLYEDHNPPAPFDKALLISGDKDFLPAAEMVARNARKDVVICFPYLQDGYKLPLGSKVKTCHVQLEDLKACHLPDEITVPGRSKILWREYVASKGWPHMRRAGG